MKKGVYILFIVSILIGCSTDIVGKEKKVSNETLINGLFSINEIDSLEKNNELKSFNYQNLTLWGGLTLYYYKDNLVLVKCSHNGELSSFTNSFYFTNENHQLSSVIDNQNFGERKVLIEINNEGQVQNLNSINSENIKLIEESIQSGNNLLKFIKANEEDIKINSKFQNTHIQLGNKSIYIKNSSDYTQNFINDLNQDGIEVTHLIDSFYIIGKLDTFQFPDLPLFGKSFNFVGEKDGLKVSIFISRRNYNSIAFHIRMDKSGFPQYNRKGVAEFGPFFYFGAETDTDFEGNGYLSTEYSDSYNSDCYVGIRIGKADNGEVLVKLKKNCNNKIQDVTLDNFPNLRLKKTNN